MDSNPLPKIQALHRRINRVLEEMPEDYAYRTTVAGILAEESEKVINYFFHMMMIMTF